MTDNKSPWKPRHGLKPLRKVTQNFRENGVQMPMIPEGLKWSIQRGAGKWMMFTSNSRLSPLLPYGLCDLPECDSLQGDFYNVKEDFILCGVNGHGANSYGLGIIARVGRLIIAQQTGFGGAYSDFQEDVKEANGQIGAWNETLMEAEALSQDEGSDYMVEFSDYRGRGRVWRRLEDSDLRTPLQPSQDPWQEGWELVVDVFPFENRDRIFFGDVEGSDVLETLAISHLLSLLKAHSRMNEQAEQLEYEIEAFDFALNQAFDPETGESI